MIHSSRITVHWSRALCCATCLLGHQALPGSVPIYTLQDGNSLVTVDVGSQAGVTGWTVDGVDNLRQQWFWYRVGSSSEASIDTISPAAVLPIGINKLQVA